MVLRAIVAAVGGAAAARGGHAHRRKVGGVPATAAAAAAGGGLRHEVGEEHARNGVLGVREAGRHLDKIDTDLKKKKNSSKSTQHLTSPNANLMVSEVHAEGPEAAGPAEGGGSPGGRQRRRRTKVVAVAVAVVVFGRWRRRQRWQRRLARSMDVAALV